MDKLIDRWMDAAGHAFILLHPLFLALNHQHSFSYSPLLTPCTTRPPSTSCHASFSISIPISISISIQEVLLRELKQTSSGDNMTSSSAGGTNNNRGGGEGGGRVSGGKMNKR